MLTRTPLYTSVRTDAPTSCAVRAMLLRFLRSGWSRVHGTRGLIGAQPNPEVSSLSVRCVVVGRHPEGLVPTGARACPRRPFEPTPTTSLVWIADPTGPDHAIGLEALPDGFEAELLQTAERSQIRTGGGIVKHVEVFPMGRVRTPIIGRPRPIPATDTQPSTVISPNRCQRRSEVRSPDRAGTGADVTRRPPNVPPTEEGAARRVRRR